MCTLSPQGICSSLMCKCMLFDIKLIEPYYYQSTKESYELILNIQQEITEGSFYNSIQLATIIIHSQTIAESSLCFN